METTKHVCLFENYEQQPIELKTITEKWSEKYESEGLDYSDTALFLKEVEAIGFTFDYFLDNEPFALRPIGVKLNQIIGYEEC